jgi:hypothetical protein
MFAGAAALVLQARPASKPGDITNALSKTKAIGSDMGYGRIDLYQSLMNVVGSSTTTTTTTSTSTSGTSGTSGK